jgi:hypothetical protein
MWLQCNAMCTSPYDHMYALTYHNITGRTHYRREPRAFNACASIRDPWMQKKYPASIAVSADKNHDMGYNMTHSGSVATMSG